MWTPLAAPTAGRARSASKWRKWGPPAGSSRERAGWLGPAWCWRAGRGRGVLPASLTEPGARFRTGAAGGEGRCLREALAWPRANSWGGSLHVERSLANQRARLAGGLKGLSVSEGLEGWVLQLWRASAALCSLWGLWAAGAEEQWCSAAASSSAPAPLARRTVCCVKTPFTNPCGSFLFPYSLNRAITTCV